MALSRNQICRNCETVYHNMQYNAVYTIRENQLMVMVLGANASGIVTV